VLPQKGAAPKTGIREDLLRVRGAGPSEMTVEWDDRFAFSLRFERAFCKALCLGYSDTPLLRREIESLRPPRGSGEVIFCLAPILGESRDSGLRLDLDARADHGISSGASRTITGKSRAPSHFQHQG
jgi:hypothetical protein